MSNELTTTNSGAIAERVMILGDLAQLSPAERVNYYGSVCKSLGLNPLTKPFDYITLNGKMVLYAKKDATDQLRNTRRVSITQLERDILEGVYVVTAHASMPDGRTDTSTGAVFIEGLKGEARANAMMKAETKAKRRATLSICGLGLLDETEVESIPNVQHVNVADDGVIEQPARVVKPAQNAAPATLDDKIEKLIAWHDSGKRVNGNNQDWANGIIDEICAARGIQLNQGDTTQGRMDALVAALKPQAVIEVTQ